MNRAKAEQKAAEREKATQATQLEDLLSQHAAEQEGADVAGNAEEIARFETEAAELEQQVGDSPSQMTANLMRYRTCFPSSIPALLGSSTNNTGHGESTAHGQCP